MNKEPKKMKKTNDCQKEMKITIPEEQVNKEYQKALSHFSGQAKIKGFRQGKAPIDLVKQMYQEDIKNAIINNLAPQAINKAFSEKKLNPVSSPVITDLDYQEGKALNLTFRFEVWPEFDLPPYKNITVKKEETDVSSKDVDKSLEDLREKSAKFNSVENRGADQDDYVFAEIKGMDLETKKMLPTEKTVVLVGHPDNEKSLNEALQGMKAEEQKKFTVEYPNDHKNKRLAGKTIQYTVQVLSIKVKSLPELNDDFAKDLGEFKDLKSLKQEIKKELRSAKKNHSQQSLTEKIMSQISDKVDIDLPETMVQQETRSNIERVLSSRPQGQQKLSAQEMDKLKKDAQKKAKDSIKNHLILNKISEKENIEISDEELEKEYKSLAETNKVPVARIKEYMNQEGRKDNLKQNLRIRKTIDFIIDNAKIEG
ncbi:MAG: trigger factor [Candidatus Aminicenantes bacterium]|nr:trigger factor [Candidatus Aminicenantes bacterium]